MTCGDSEESYRIIKACALRWNFAGILRWQFGLSEPSRASVGGGLFHFCGVGRSLPFRREDKVWTGQSRGAVGSALGFDPLTLIPLWWPTAALEDQWSGTERTVLETPLVGLAQSRPGAASSCSHPRTVVLGPWFPSDCEHTGPCTLLTIGNRVLFWKPLAYTSTPGFFCCVFASSPATPQQILQVFPSACLRDCPGASPSPSVLWILGLLFGLPDLLSSPRLDHVTPHPKLSLSVT